MLDGDVAISTIVPFDPIAHDFTIGLVVEFADFRLQFRLAAQRQNKSNIRCKQAPVECCTLWACYAICASDNIDLICKCMVLKMHDFKTFRSKGAFDLQFICNTRFARGVQQLTAYL